MPKTVNYQVLYNRERRESSINRQRCQWLREQFQASATFADELKAELASARKELHFTVNQREFYKTALRGAEKELERLRREHGE